MCVGVGGRAVLPSPSGGFGLDNGDLRKKVSI